MLLPPPRNMFSLAGKTVVVTGGSGGLGMTVSRYLLQAGASLALIDNNLPKLEPAATTLSEWYSDPANKVDHAENQIISSWACDISDADQVQSTVAAIRNHHRKPLDVLVNAAGYCENIPAIDYPALNIKRLVDVNLTGSLFMAREFAKCLIADNHPGSIILIASMSGSVVNFPQPQTPYNMTKAGVIHMAKSLASEWASHNIRVNSLSPGYILTPLTKAIIDTDTRLKAEWESKVPLGRMADPEEFAGPIIFMASGASSYMTGHDLVVDGGYTVW
jgi:D-arabinitol 2-dehydrogenase